MTWSYTIKAKPAPWIMALVGFLNGETSPEEAAQAVAGVNKEADRIQGIADQADQDR